MHLCPDGVMQLFSRMPCLAVAKPGACRTYLARRLRDGIELEAMLAQFPAVQYEPLDQHYALLRCLGGLCEALVSDLCAHDGWRGIMQASLLVALAPGMQYRQHLSDARARAPNNQWLVDLALCEIDGTIWREDPTLQDLVRRLRGVLPRSLRPAVTFPRAPSPQEFQTMEAERGRVKQVYRSAGPDAARKEILNTRYLKLVLAPPPLHIEYTSMLTKARAFAIQAHGEQRYGDKPYSYHLDMVAEILAPYGLQAQVVGYLHDLVEDTSTTRQQVEEEFGSLVAACVDLLTDEPGANRKERKAKTYDKLSRVSGPTQLALVAKVADRLANVKSCVADDNRALWKLYLSEQSTFKAAAYRAGLCDTLWTELDELLKGGAADASG